MPIYEYICQKCEETTEALQKFSDKPLSKCPRCGGKLAKLMSMNSFQLKGGGWYITDYAGKKVEEPKPAAGAREAGKPEAKAEKPKKAADAK